MFQLPAESLKPGMVIYDDVYNRKKKLLFKANTELTADKIKIIIDEQLEDVVLAEPSEVGMTRYQHLHISEHFHNFNAIYNQGLEQFSKIMRTLDTGLELNTIKLLMLRDDILSSVMGDEQLLDYIYNLMPNENEITYNHCFNCGLMMYVFAKWCDYPKDTLDNVTLCGYLFDIGKTKISNELLWKTSRLTPEEMVQMQHHIHLGYELIKSKKLPPHVVTVMLMHHERLDGTGYPARLKGDRIDNYALLAAIADTYEAMTHPRAQRLAMTPFAAIRVFEEQGFAKYGEQYASRILTNVANMYVDRRVALNNGLEGRITEIHEGALSYPTIFTNNIYYDMRQHPEATIVRMI